MAYGLYCEVLALLGLRQYPTFCILSLHATGYNSNLDLFTWPRCFLQICIKAHILPGEWCTKNVQGKFLQDFKLEEKIKILIVLSCLPWMAFIVLGASNTRLRCTRPHPPIVSLPIILSSKLIFALSLSSGEFLSDPSPIMAMLVTHWLTDSVTAV